MAEAVGAAGTEDHEVGLEGVQQFRGAGRRTSVVRRFENRDRRGLQVRQHGCFAFLSDVTGQNDRHVPVSQLDDDGVVVADALAFPVGAWRVEDPYVDLRQTDVLAALDEPPFETGGLRIGDEIASGGVRRHGNAFPDRARPERPMTARAPPM